MSSLVMKISLHLRQSVCIVEHAQKGITYNMMHVLCVAYELGPIW